MQFQICLLLVIGMIFGAVAIRYDSDEEIEKRQAGSCIHPPTDVLKKLACMTSCALQNCATGSCIGKTCNCARCQGGPVGPWKRTVDEDVEEENSSEASSEVEKRQAGSCIHPPTDVLKKLACMTSCALQNCATGSCIGQTCHCARCENGPVGP